MEFGEKKRKTSSSPIADKPRCRVG